MLYLFTIIEKQDDLQYLDNLIFSLEKFLPNYKLIVSSPYFISNDKYSMKRISFRKPFEKSKNIYENINELNKAFSKKFCYCDIKCALNYDISYINDLDNFYYDNLFYKPSENSNKNIYDINKHHILYDKIILQEKNTKQFHLYSFATKGNGYDLGKDCYEMAKHFHDNNFNGFYTKKLFTPSDFHDTDDESWCIKNYEGVEYENGYNHKYNNIGMGAWRPLIIEKALNSHKDGDIILFQDIDIQKNPDINSLGQIAIDYCKVAEKILINENGYVFTTIDGKTTPLQFFCKKEVIDFFKLDKEDYEKRPSIQARTIVIRVCDKTRIFFKKVCSLCKDYPELLLKPSLYDKTNDNYPMFRWHPYEQTVINCLGIKENIFSSLPYKDNWIYNLSLQFNTTSGLADYNYDNMLNYLFFINKNTDILGHDITRVNFNNINELKHISLSNPSVKSFNSLGFLKHQNDNNLFKKYPLYETDLFVKKVPGVLIKNMNNNVDNLKDCLDTLFDKQKHIQKIIYFEDINEFNLFKKNNNKYNIHYLNDTNIIDDLYIIDLKEENLDKNTIISTFFINVKETCEKLRIFKYIYGDSLLNFSERPIKQCNFNEDIYMYNMSKTCLMVNDIIDISAIACGTIPILRYEMTEHFINFFGNEIYPLSRFEHYLLESDDQDEYNLEIISEKCINWYNSNINKLKKLL